MENYELRMNEILCLEPGIFELTASETVWVSGEKDFICPAKCSRIVSSVYPLIIEGIKESGTRLSYRMLAEDNSFPAILKRLLIRQRLLPSLRGVARSV